MKVFHIRGNSQHTRSVMFERNDPQRCLTAKCMSYHFRAHNCLVRLIKVISNLVCGSINERSIAFSLEKMTKPEKILQYGRGKISNLPIKGRIRLFLFCNQFYFQLRTLTCKLQAIIFEGNTWDMAPLGHAFFSLNVIHRYILLVSKM